MAAPASVLVVLSEPGAHYQAAARALRAEVDRRVPGQVNWSSAEAATLPRVDSRPQWVVAVGTVALQRIRERMARQPGHPPVLAVMVTRETFLRGADPAHLRAGVQSAVFIDQPPARQLELIRLAIPGVQRLGMLLGETSQVLRAEFEGAARGREPELKVAKVGTGGLPDALQRLLPEVEALLAVADPDVYNGETAPYILAAAYRQRIPLFGFSPAYVRAGALASLYSSPEQIGRSGGAMLAQALGAGSLPAPSVPREFLVSVNPDVARSLGIVLSEESLVRQLRQREQP